MIVIKAHFDGLVIVPDEPVPLPVNQPLVLHVQVVAPQSPSPRDDAEPDLPSYLTLDQDREL